MPIIRLDPDVDRWREDMTRMWSRMTQDWGQGLSSQPHHFVSDTGDALLVEVELPGVDPEGVDLEADADSIMIQGAWAAPRVGVDSPRRSGHFHLTIGLPVDVEPDRASARFEHGLLTVDLPKAHGPRRRLDIRVETPIAAR